MFLDGVYNNINADESIVGLDYTTALEQEGFEEKLKNAHISDILGFIRALKTGGIAASCSGNVEEDRRREQVLLAVEAARKRLGMHDWPLDATRKESHEDFCAFEALVFFSNPEALIASNLSISRAALRKELGQRQMCGWIDTMLMCIHTSESSKLELSSKRASNAFLMAAAQNHLDYSSTLIGTSLNPMLPYCDSLTLSKMFVLVEELVASDSTSFEFDSVKKKYFEPYEESEIRAPFDMTDRELVPVMVTRPSVGAEIESNGKLSYVWALMLYELINGEKMKPGEDFFTRYPQFKPETSLVGEYMHTVFKSANQSWVQESLVLIQALYLVSLANSAAFQRSGTWQQMTTTLGLGSCIDAGEGGDKFLQSKSSRPLQLMAAKTWALTRIAVVVGQASIGPVLTIASTALSFATFAAKYPIATAFWGNAVLTRLAAMSPVLAAYIVQFRSLFGQDVLDYLARDFIRTMWGGITHAVFSAGNFMGMAGILQSNFQDADPQSWASSLMGFMEKWGADSPLLWIPLYYVNYLSSIYGLLRGRRADGG